MKKQAKQFAKQRFVVVVAKTPGTNWARVVAGDLVSERELEDGTSTVVLAEARQALYYGKESGGEFGLAANGPKGDSRITAPLVCVKLAGATLIADASPDAASAWKAAPIWSGK